MSSSANSHARLIFKDAFDKLKETVDSINPKHTPVFQNTTLEDVFNASREIEKALAERNCLRNMRRLTPVLKGLEHYSKSVEVLCNGTPYLPWIWAPIKVTLQIASEFPAAMEKLITAYSKITEVMPRFDRLSEAFEKDQTLHQVMAMAYADILDFHQEAYSLFSRPGWRIFFSTLWGKAERRFKVILDSLAKNCQLVETEAKTAEIVEASRFRIKIKEQMREQENERTVMRLQSALAWLDAKDEEQESELDRLRGRVFEHSCDWIQRHNEAKAWMSMRGTQPILWLIGKPGAGKSTLSATIIQFLLQDRHSAVLYYLCNHQSSKSADSAHVLRTLISELLRLNNDIAGKIYEEHITKGHAPSIPRLKQLLQILLGEVPSTRIIIDGVDELEDRCRSQVLGDILALATVSNSKTTCKVLVSSRDISSISKMMSKYPKLNLNQERHFLDTSITSFVHHGLNDIRSRVGQTQNADNRIYREIEQILIEKAEGMFLWIRLVIHALQDSGDILELRRTVHELPKDLDQMYSKVLDRMMKDLGPSKWEAAKTIFTWMVHGARYLKSFELLSAVSLHLGSMSQGYYAYEWEWALNKCKPLLEITKSGTVSFTHCTVYEYFTKGTGIMRIDPLRAHLEISHGCLSCLTQGLDIMNPQWSPKRLVLEVTGGRYALIRYSMDYWLRHILDSLNRLNDRNDLDKILEAIDELDDRDGVIKETCSLEKPKPITDVELVDESKLSREILNLPHLKDMLVNHLRFENSIKNKEFSSGKEVDCFRSDYDPSCFSLTSQTYQDVVHQIIGPDGHSSDPSIQFYVGKFKQQFASFAYCCRFWGCGAYLGSVTELETHETMHSGGIKCAESTCPFSHIGFASAVALKRHMRKYHPQEINIPAAPRAIRRKHICSGVVDGVAWGCKQRFAVERELHRHIASRQGTNCDQSYIRLQQTPASDLPQVPVSLSFDPPIPRPMAASMQQSSQPNPMQNQQINQQQFNQVFDVNAVANPHIKALRVQDQGQEVIPVSGTRKPRVLSEKRTQSMTQWWAERKARQKKLDEQNGISKTASIEKTSSTNKRPGEAAASASPLDADATQQLEMQLAQSQTQAEGSQDGLLPKSKGKVLSTVKKLNDDDDEGEIDTPEKKKMKKKSSYVKKADSEKSSRDGGTLKVKLKASSKDLEWKASESSDRPDKREREGGDEEGAFNKKKLKLSLGRSDSISAETRFQQQQAHAQAQIQAQQQTAGPDSSLAPTANSIAIDRSKTGTRTSSLPRTAANATATGRSKAGTGSPS